MQGNFKSKKISVLIIGTISVLSMLYSSFVSADKRTLKQEMLVTNEKPKLRSYDYARGGSIYWVEFHFINHYDSSYKLSDNGLKYSDYHSLMKNIQSHDTLLIQSDKEHIIYSIYFKGKNYVDKVKVLEWEDNNYRFTIFCRIIICIACLPILFFKRQPKFWYNGFEFEFSFTFLFITIFGIAISIYFYYHGIEYLIGVDRALLR